MILALFYWLLKSILILGIFHFAIPPIVNAFTRNRWIKFPIMFILGILAGIFMAWIRYVPYLLFFIWLMLNKYTLSAMLEPKFKTEANMKIRKSVFYVSSYSYIVIACTSAWLLQMEVLQKTEPTGPGIPLWKYLLGG
ncbi:MAG: hypothetical protein ACOY90_15110 [Candidatus Zhuqueibacterota bacterium]